MSNTKNLANLAAALDDGVSGQVLTSQGSGAVAFTNASGGGSMTVYATLDALAAVSSPSIGDLGFVTSNNTVYVRASSGWRKIATVQESPGAITGHSASYPYIADNATTDITLSSTDPEGFDVTWSYAVGGNGTLSGSNINNSNGDTLASIAVQTANANSGGTNTITYRITRETTTVPGDWTITFTATDSQSTGTSDTGAIAFSVSFIDWPNATQQAKIQASDASATDFFGAAVSLSTNGDTAIVGAYTVDDGSITASGAAYIFTRSGTSWSQQQKLEASDPSANDNFGRHVAMSGDGNTVIIGAYFKNANSVYPGAAYIFTRSGSSWSQQAKLEASDAQSFDYFGWSVSISNDGNTVVIGAYDEDTTATSAGSAYIFTRSGSSWSQQQKIQASDAQASDLFGRSVAISGDGDTVIVGAHYEDTTATDAGSAYVFTRSGTTWSQEQKIQASNAGADDRFGEFVAISNDGDTALVGALKEDTGGSDAGAAYVFTRSGTTWSQQTQLQSSDIQAGDWFGYTVSLSNDGDTALIGAKHESEGGTSAGAAYVFTRSGTTWSQQKKLTASDAAANDQFGECVAISGDGNTAIVGAHYEDTTATDAGAAYIFVN